MVPCKDCVINQREILDMTRPTICLIDDEVALREVVRRYLEHAGYCVVEVETGTEALALLQQQSFDLILLDIMLPVLDGFNLMRVLQHSDDFLALNQGIPVIMLTSRDDEADRITGFELGVDDYIIKPFSLREMVARVKAVLRRSQSPAEGETEKSLQYGAMHIDALRRMVHIDKIVPVLTMREFDLLWMLASHPQQVFTRTQLLDKVWGMDFYGDESTVTVHIRRLREKIEPDAASPTWIQTVWGVGYKFEPPSND
jgi:DNA-binding response OmpR family regulator